MAENLEDLIQKIKSEGVEEAKKESEQIIKNAQEQAQEIITKAKKRSEEILNGANDEAEKKKKNAEDSIRQAARDMVLVVKEQLAHIFDRILKREISKNLDSEFICELIRKIVTKWSSGKEAPMEVTVNEKDKKRLEELLLSELRERARDIIEIKVSNNIKRGFRIGLKGEDIYYDFSEESILESLKEFLSLEYSKILEEKNG